jgi:spore germination protein GerM
MARSVLVPDRPVATDAVVTVAVSREFTEVAGGNQLLATAQVVFTVTEVPGVAAVRVTADGSPVEVPTDAGLTDEPVRREDYASVAGPSPAPATPERRPR